MNPNIKKKNQSFILVTKPLEGVDLDPLLAHRKLSNRAVTSFSINKEMQYHRGAYSNVKNFPEHRKSPDCPVVKQWSSKLKVLAEVLTWKFPVICYDKFPTCCEHDLYEVAIFTSCGWRLNVQSLVSPIHLVGYYNRRVSGSDGHNRTSPFGAREWLFFTVVIRNADA
uniref:(California timema) hypothetical protein n=1 Tax=Timema californicum TaxID=61474 RepID=A0A7R9J6E2_TIMCA|nr:unnamed protein product [Timema californicum]